MAKPARASDFKEFLRFLNSNGVEYLLVGGYAVALHGFIRATNDLDVWVRTSPENAARVVRALNEFGFRPADLTPALFWKPDSLVRLGVPPIRIGILTTISGVDFDTCYAERETTQIEDLTIPAISLPRLRQNKAASARAKDLADLENLPE
jgi:hypothetical protein